MDGGCRHRQVHRPARDLEKLPSSGAAIAATRTVGRGVEAVCVVKAKEGHGRRA